MRSVGRGGDLVACLCGEKFLVVAAPIGDISGTINIDDHLITIGASVADKLAQWIRGTSFHRHLSLPRRV